MTTSLIIGSGVAAAGTALALSRREDLQITVVDIGLELENERQQLIDSLGSSTPDKWDVQVVESISQQQADSRNRRVPEKRVFGSNYPFRNVGQLGSLTVADGAEKSLISPAYGGFSNVWGSQLMPFTEPIFESWPVSATVMRRHYEAILRQIPFAGEEDDLANNFPLMRPPAALPPMSPRSLRVLNAYERNRTKLNERGITIGKARLGLAATNCIRCGMCMTGCPYGLIYSAAQTFDKLRRANRVTHHSGFLVLKITEEADKVSVITKEIATGQIRRFESDRVYVACGAMGTTRLVANSLNLFDVDIPMLESQQFVLPALSAHATEDPRRKQDFTLNQFNVIVAPDGDRVDISTLHFYTFNRAFTNALPPVLRVSSAEWISGAATTPPHRRVRLPAIVEVPTTTHSRRISSQTVRPSGISYFWRNRARWPRSDAAGCPAAAHSIGSASGSVSGDTDVADLRSRKELPLGRKLPPRS